MADKGLPGLKGLAASAGCPDAARRRLSAVVRKPVSLAPWHLALCPTRGIDGIPHRGIGAPGNHDGCPATRKIPQVLFPHAAGVVSRCPPLLVWHKGELLPLLADLQRELDEARRQAEEEKRRADALQQRLGAAERELAELRARLGQR